MGALIGFFNAEKVSPAGLERAYSQAKLEMVRGGKLETLEWESAGLRITQMIPGKVSRERWPASSRDGRLVIFLDGEVFNPDIKAGKGDAVDVQKHISHLDEAHYCLETYEKYGEAGFELLNGYFTLIIFDTGNGELLIACDRFASRPLFMWTKGAQTAFSTQFGPLTRFPGVGKELDLQSVFEFFTFQKVLEERTHFRCIRQLPPASVFRHGREGSGLKRFWRMTYREDHSTSLEGYSEILAESIRDSVRARMRGRERKGLLLSGGLDSRAVLAAAENGGEIESITIADLRNREVRTAEELAARAGSRHHFLPRPKGHYATIIDDAVRIGGGLYRFDHAHLINLFDKIGEWCDLLFHGFDPEVLFRGSNLPRRSFRLLGRKIVMSSLLRFSQEELVDVILDEAHYSTWHLAPVKLFRRDLALGYERSIREAVARVLEECPADTSILNRFDWFIVHNRFRYPSALFILSIRPFLGERSFLCDNNLMDLYLRIPPEVRAKASLWAGALLRLDPGIAAVRDANTGLAPLAPRALAIAGKAAAYARRRLGRETSATQGSWPNFSILLREDRSLKELVLQTLGDPHCLDPDIFDTERIREIARLHLEGKEDHATELYLLTTFGRWHRLYA